MARQEETSRKIHLDFHTPHWVKQVGQNFNAEQLVQTWKQARVNAVTVVFGYCACGNAYYENAAGQVHPGLQQDLLIPLLSAANLEGIKIYVHFSVGIHDRAVLEHPEWAMQRKNGSRLDTEEGKWWGWPCFNSPFVEEWFWPQLRDFIPRFPDVAGIFLDMVMYPTDTCYCQYCHEKAVANGLVLSQRKDMERFERLTLDRFMEDTRKIIKSLNPNMEFTCNNQWFVGGARNEALDFIELEAPVSWNSYHYPVMSRYIRTLPKPSGGMTTRFPKNWGYFGSLNNETQLKFECATIMATLGSCCIGDQLHPSGKPDDGVYELIGEAYRFVEEREPWTLHAQSVPYIAIMADQQRNAQVSGEELADYDHQSSVALYGSGLMMLEGNRHFDVLDQQSDISAYKLVWLAENKTLDPALAERLEQYVSGGGKLLVTGSGLWEVPEWRCLLEKLADVEMEGTETQSGTYIRPLPIISKGVPPIPYFVKGKFVRWKPGKHANIAAEIVRLYENIDPDRRFGHFHAPAGDDSGSPAAVIRQYGKGKVCMVATPLSEDYFRIGSRHIRQIVMNITDELLAPSERIVEVDAANPSVEISLMSQKNRWILHLVQYGAKRNTGNTVVEEVPIRYQLPIRVRTPYVPRNVYVAPSGLKLDWSWKDGQLQSIVPELHIHQMVVMEWE